MTSQNDRRDAEANPADAWFVPSGRADSAGTDAVRKAAARVAVAARRANGEEPDPDILAIADLAESEQQPESRRSVKDWFAHLTKQRAS